MYANIERSATRLTARARIPQNRRIPTQAHAMPTLYVVPTPIGNLEDITLRALRILGEVELIAAEDTRVTRKLLSRHSIRAPLTSFHEHNKARRLPELLRRLSDEDIALVSDAGSPAINDPGQELITAAAESGFAVVVLPGASAVTTALIASGIPSSGFIFLGYLPRGRTERAALLSQLAAEPRTLVAFETPHRLAAALADLRAALGDRRIAVCREMTKLHEETFRGPISEAIAHFTHPRGEFTLVIEGSPKAPAVANPEEAKTLLSQSRSQGMTARDAISAAIPATGLSRRHLYTLWLTLD